MSRMKLILARQALCHGGLLVKDAGILIRGGRIIEIATSAAGTRRLVRNSGVVPEDHGPGIWTAGLVNAHAHLELTALGNAVPRLPFARWVSALMGARSELGRTALSRGLAQGADRLLNTGTSTVGDNDSLGLAAGVLASHPIRARVFREALDAWDPKRTAKARRFSRAPRRGTATLAFGFGPHAPFTVSSALARSLAQDARRRRAPISIHFAESRGENQWMLTGNGPLAGVLPKSPGISSLDYLEEASLLGSRSALVHCNHVKKSEIERIAQSGACVVHCPKSHEFFRRAKFDPEPWLRAGVVMALGTDSVASNPDLDMRAEMARLRETSPNLNPERIWTMATEGGARCLGWGQRLGRLEPGRAADLALWDLAPRSRAGALEALTGSSPEIRQMIVAGRAQHSVS